MASAEPWAKPTFTHVIDGQDFQVSRVTDPHAPEVIYVSTFFGDLTPERLALIQEYVPSGASLNDVERQEQVWHLEFVASP